MGHNRAIRRREFFFCLLTRFFHRLNGCLKARANPLFTTMILAWSATEVIRCSFYSCNLLALESYHLFYLRYTTFFVLYPLGALSEAFLIYSTLPGSCPVPGVKSWPKGDWKPTDYVRATLFAVWWFGEYLHFITSGFFGFLNILQVYIGCTHT